MGCSNSKATETATTSDKKVSPAWTVQATVWSCIFYIQLYLMENSEWESMRCARVGWCA